MGKLRPKRSKSSKRMQRSRPRTSQEPRPTTVPRGERLRRKLRRPRRPNQRRYRAYALALGLHMVFRHGVVPCPLQKSTKIRFLADVEETLYFPSRFCVWVMNYFLLRASLTE